MYLNEVREQDRQRSRGRWYEEAVSVSGISGRGGESARASSEDVGHGGLAKYKIPPDYNPQ